MVKVLFLFYLVFFVSTQVVPQTEVQALKNFYNTLGGKNWINSRNWNTDPNLCTLNGWFGIVCWVDELKTPHILTIDLTSNNLSGTFHDFQDWDMLPYLQSIFLDINFISGSIPDNFWSVPNLKHIFIGSNKLEGVLSSSFNSSQIIDLELSSNQISGTISPEFTSIPTMKKLILFNNLLSGEIPDTFQKMPQLTYLSLSGNSFSGPIPLSIYQCTELNYLDLGYNLLLNGTISDQIVNLKKLNELHLEYNSFSGPIPRSFYYLQNLSIINLHYNQLSGSLSNYFYDMKIPTNLNLRNNLFEGRVPNYFMNSYGWEDSELILSGNPFLCPIIQEATILYGATCVSADIVNVTPTVIFREISNNITVVGENFPTSLSKQITCQLGEYPESIIGEVIYMDSENVICEFGPSQLEGNQHINLLLDGLKVVYNVPSVIVFGIPNITSIIPDTWREQGDMNQKIAVNGNGFIETGGLNCLFRNEFNFTEVPATYVDYRNVLCPIPEYFLSPIVDKVKMDFFVSNYGTHYHEHPQTFVYFPWCYGFPACGGKDKGTCILGEPGQRPKCQCKTDGFDNSTYCFNCLKQHYGPNCSPCPNCNNGVCEDDHHGSGSCKCDYYYIGSDCTVNWLGFTIPIVIIVAILIVGVLVYFIYFKKKDEVYVDTKKEEAKDYEYKNF